MQRHLAAEDGGRAIGLVLVRERTAALHRVLHVRKRRRRIIMLIVASADAEREPIVAEGLRRSRRLARQAHALRIEIKARPLCAGERPFALVAHYELLPRLAHLQLHARLPVPAVALPLEEIAEEALLQIDAVI